MNWSERIGALGARVLYRAVWDGREFDGIEYALEGTQLVVAPDGDEIGDEDVHGMLAYTYLLVGVIVGSVGAVSLLLFAAGVEDIVTGQGVWGAAQIVLGVAVLYALSALDTMPELDIDVVDEVSEA